MAESMMGLKRSHRCTEVTTADIGREVTVMGWVQKSRNKGGIIFVDLRDRSGILQIIFEESDCGAEDFAKAEKLRSEFVVAVTGRVEARSGAVNENLATGAIEVRAHSMRVLAESETPPFPIEENLRTKEELRLKYRFLDLRRPDLQRNLITRSRVATLTRAFLAEEGFLEIETPTLIKSTPEGARDYLVPSRVHPGSFYALPQSPQIYKQLLMCSGYDRYFQLARCYRDEDLRADREGVAPLHQRRAPAAGLLREGEQPGVEADFQRLLLRGDLLQDGVSDRRFEEHIADPSRAEAVGTSVMGGQRVAELPEKSALKAVVAVHGAYARRSEHAPEPGGLLDEQHVRTHAGGGDARGRSGGSAPDDQQVVTGVRPAAGEQRGGAQYR